MAYLTAGGYSVLRSCLSGARPVDDVIATLSDGGCAGSAAPAPHRPEWSLVRSEKGPRLMAVNGDEGEPGTFKDRHYLEREPHRSWRETLIAAWAVEAEEVFIYIRDEYPAVLEILSRKLPISRLQDWPRIPSSAFDVAPAPTSAAKRAR